MLKYINNSTRTPRQEVLTYLEMLCRNVNRTSEYYIAFENGIYNLQTKEMTDFDKNISLQIKLGQITILKHIQKLWIILLIKFVVMIRN